MRWSPALALAGLAVAAAAGFMAFPTYPAYDSLYAFVWAREILDGVRPSFDGYRAPTEHPLLFPFALVLAPLGDLGLRVFVALCVASFVALVAATYRLGLRASGVLGGVVAASLIASRLNFPFFAAIGFLDVPYCALIAWAAVLEIDRPRRGGVVWVLLALAGLLRPEAWLLAGLYALRIGWHAPWIARLRAAALAAVAPLLWSAVDLVVTGDPLFSLSHTDASATELQRERSLWTLPWLTVKHLDELLKWPVLVAAVVGLGLAFLRRRHELAPLAALIPATCFSYLVIASGGLATIWRYLMLAAVALAVFAGYALAGWTELAEGRARRAWAGAACVLLVAAAVFTVTRTHPGDAVRQLDERASMRADLLDLVESPAFRRASSCGPISVPNHKLLPELRWLLDLPDGAIRARSDRRGGPVESGAFITIAGRLEHHPAVNIHEVPTDHGDLLEAPPAQFGLAYANRSFALWAACGPGDEFHRPRQERPT